jgi:hypothetical protein
MTTDLRIVVRDNVRRLLDITPGESGVQRLINLGISTGAAQRLMAVQTSIGRVLLEEIASKLRVQPWQLLVPALDPRNPPVLGQTSHRWPFRSISQQSIAELSDGEAEAVEAGLRVALATARAALDESSAKRYGVQSNRGCGA